jgi:hypothetical protein
LFEIERRHCERSEAIHLAAQRKNGLLRCARNDDALFEDLQLFEIVDVVVCGAFTKPRLSCPDLIHASIHLRNEFLRGRWIIGSSPVMTISWCDDHGNERLVH